MVEFGDVTYADTGEQVRGSDTTPRWGNENADSDDDTGGYGNQDDGNRRHQDIVLQKKSSLLGFENVGGSTKQMVRHNGRVLLRCAVASCALQGFRAAREGVLSSFLAFLVHLAEPGNALVAADHPAMVKRALQCVVCVWPERQYYHPQSPVLAARAELTLLLHMV